MGTMLSPSSVTPPAPSLPTPAQQPPRAISGAEEALATLLQHPDAAVRAAAAQAAATRNESKAGASTSATATPQLDEATAWSCGLDIDPSMMSDVTRYRWLHGADGCGILEIAGTPAAVDVDVAEATVRL